MDKLIKRLSAATGPAAEPTVGMSLDYVVKKGPADKTRLLLVGKIAGAIPGRALFV
jgi:hypothetical protein